MNAAATGVYAIAVVLITYEMSRRIANTGWLQLVVSGLIVLGITWFHSTLLEVIVVQQVLRVVLLIAVACPSSRCGRPPAGGFMKKLRRVTEAEVIAEFLKNEFYQEEFHEDREQFEQLVLGAQIMDETGNALRRALLFRRRGHMWRELPDDTQWWEVQIESQDLERVRVFPRAQWRRVANGSFLLKDIVRRIKTRPFRGTNPRLHRQSAGLELSPAQSPGRERDTADRYRRREAGNGAGRQSSPHGGPAGVAGGFADRFRVFCGLSPHMSQSCWYQTNLPNLWRYARNRARNLVL